MGKYLMLLNLYMQRGRA